MKLTEAQQEVWNRYLEATKDCPDTRLPVEKIIGMRSKIPKWRPDNSRLKKLEEERINDMEESKPLKGRPKKEIESTVVLDFLSTYFDNYDIAVEDYYWIDDIFTGVSRLDLGGNTRDLSKYHLFDVLTVCSKIDVDFVQQYLDVGTRQAQKVLLAIGIAHRMLEKEIVTRGLCAKD